MFYLLPPHFHPSDCLYSPDPCMKFLGNMLFFAGNYRCLICNTSLLFNHVLICSWVNQWMLTSWWIHILSPIHYATYKISNTNSSSLFLSHIDLDLQSDKYETLSFKLSLILILFSDFFRKICLLGVWNYVREVVIIS